MDKIFQSVSNKLGALIRLRRYLGKNGRKVIVDSFIYSNFNYCPLIWKLSSF